MESSEKEGGLSRFAMEVITGAAIVCFGVVVCLGARQVGVGWEEAGPLAGYFPFYVGWVAIISGLGSIVMAFLHFRKGHEIFLSASQGKRVFKFFAPMLAFVVVASFLGLYVALALYLLVTMSVQGGFRWYTALAVGLGAAVLFYFVFDVWFQTPLLKGPLEHLLGIY